MPNPLLLKPAPFFITVDVLKKSQVRSSGLGSVTTLRAIQAMIDKHSTWYVGGTRACDLPTCHRQILCRGPGKSHSPALGHWPGLGLTSHCSLMDKRYTERGQTWLWGRGTHGSTLKLHGGSRYWEQDAAMFPGIRKDTNKKPVVPPSCPQVQGRLSLMPSKELPQQYRSGKG